MHSDEKQKKWRISVCFRSSESLAEIIWNPRFQLHKESPFREHNQHKEFPNFNPKFQEPNFQFNFCESLQSEPLFDLRTKEDMECVVQGIIETQHVEALEILLQGLCGVQRERLRIHEICLKSGPNLGSVASEVRILCNLEQAEPSWTVRHIGGAMRGAGAEQISVLVRTMVESKASKNVLRLFYTLGYKLDHELLRVGFSFHFYRGAQITVTVSSINKMLKLHATDEAVPVTPGIQLVEVTAPASAETYTEVASAVSSFCEYLAPLLHLSKPGISTGVVPTAAAAAASLIQETDEFREKS